MFYSEAKGEYLRNIGYIGEQIDLYLASENIGALWFGIGKPEEKQRNGLDYVIMISIAKMPEDKFRKDMFKSKRKSLDEIWSGDTLNISFERSLFEDITDDSVEKTLVARYQI